MCLLRLPDMSSMLAYCEVNHHVIFHMNCLYRTVISTVSQHIALSLSWLQAASCACFLCKHTHAVGLAVKAGSDKGE